MEHSQYRNAVASGQPNQYEFLTIYVRTRRYRVTVLTEVQVQSC